MEILFQFFYEIYLEIVMFAVPENKLKKWQKNLLKAMCVLVSATMILLISIGISFLMENVKDIVGIALISSGFALLIVQIVLFVGIRIYAKKQ